MIIIKPFHFLEKKIAGRNMAEAIEFEDEEKGNFIMITTLPNEPSPSQTIPIPGLRYYDNDAEMRLIKAEIHSPLFDKDIEKLNGKSL